MSVALERLSVSQNKEETGRVRVDFGSIFVYNTTSSYNVAVGKGDLTRRQLRAAKSLMSYTVQSAGPHSILLLVICGKGCSIKNRL